MIVGSSFADTKEGRYNPKMHPVIPVENWRKGSQVTIQITSIVSLNLREDPLRKM